MADNNVYDKRVETMKQRLAEELVDEQGQPAEPDDVASVVDAKAESLAEAPVQEFIPLLIEHQVRDELREQGLRRDLGDETDDPGRVDAASVGADRSTGAGEEGDRESPPPK